MQNKYTVIWNYKCSYVQTCELSNPRGQRASDVAICHKKCLQIPKRGKTARKWSWSKVIPSCWVESSKDMKWSLTILWCAVLWYDVIWYDKMLNFASVEFRYILLETWIWRQSTKLRTVPWSRFDEMKFHIPCTKMSKLYPGIHLIWCKTMQQKAVWYNTQQ